MGDSTASMALVHSSSVPLDVCKISFRMLSGLIELVQSSPRFKNIDASRVKTRPVLIRSKTGVNNKRLRKVSEN